MDFIKTIDWFRLYIKNKDQEQADLHRTIKFRSKQAALATVSNLISEIDKVIIRIEQFVRLFHGMSKEDKVGWCNMVRKTFCMVYSNISDSDKIYTVYLGCLRDTAGTRAQIFITDTPGAALDYFLAALTDMFRQHNTNVERYRYLSEMK